MRMDQTDYQILNLLQEDGRRSLRYIGKRVALSPSAVKERFHRLEDFGAISGYQAQIDRSPLGYHVSGFIFAAVDSKKYVVFCDFCAQAPEITAFYHMVGNFNVLLRFAVHDVKALDALVARIKTFGDSRTSIELQTVFEKKTIRPVTQ